MQKEVVQLDKTMRAAVFTEFGGPDVIHVEEIPLPEIRPDEVLVKVQSAVVNNVDTYIRRGIYVTPLADPHVIGRDLVGVVEAVGSETSGFTPGQLVWTNSAGFEGRPGAAAEYVAVSVARLYQVPAGVDPERMIATVHPGATAAILLDSVMQVRPGQRILIEGAAGNVGRALVTLAVMLKLEVATTSSVADFSALQALGVRTTLDYHAEFYEERRGAFDHIVDTSGQVNLQVNLDYLRENGEVTLITAPASNHFDFDVRAFYMNQKHINGFVLSKASEQQLAEAAVVLNDTFVKGQLLDFNLRTMPLSEAAEAHRLMDEGKVGRQRLLLQPSR